MNSLNESSSIQSPDEIDDDIPSPTMGGTNNNSKKKPSKKPKSITDIKACR
jgi:hypothetical protein